MMRKFLFFAAMMMSVPCCTNAPLTMTEGEAALINDSTDVMRILTVEDDADLALLRKASTNFNMADLKTSEYTSLTKKMVATLESTDGGVGLAAPQVGINRRVVAVMRVDKEGEPIEVYPNIRIEQYEGPLEEGPEGCLSVPDRRGNVLRYKDITIVYTDVNTDRMEHPCEIREHVTGFAAVIFQHELDHLDGVLYIDKLSSQADDIPNP